MTTILGGLEVFGQAAAPWLLTYWIHSTILLGSAWILGRWAFKGEAWREVIWKAALVGGLVTTATAQVFATGWEVPLNWPVGGATGGAVAEVAAEVVDDIAAPDAPVAAGAPTVSPEAPVAREAASTGTPGEVAELDATPPAGRMEDASIRTEGFVASGPWALIAAWLVVAVVLLGGLAGRHARLRSALRDRQVVSDGPLPAMLAKLRRSTGVWRAVRLSATPSVATPLALGRSEICVPARFIDGLGAEEQRAALAHELGHLVRRDPLWHFAVQVLQAVFFFQPLHHVARRRLRQSAEFLADAWAVRETGSRMGLARCLAEVADWVSAGDPRDVASSVAMAEGGSPLATRVRRLLDGEVESAKAPAAIWLVAASLVALTAGFGPAVASEASTSLEAASGNESAALFFEPQDVEVVRVVSVGGFPERVTAAEGQAETSGARAYWLAYVVEGSVEVGEDVAEDSGPMTDQSPYGAAEGVLQVADQVGPAGSGDLMVFAQVTPREPTARVVRLALRSPGLGLDLQGRTVYWLGRALPGESLDWARGVFDDDSQDLEIRATALEIVSRHPLADARQILGEVATGTEQPEVREEAVEGLGLYRDDVAVGILTQIAGDDPDLEIRAEAAETLGDMNFPAAGPALVIVTRSSDSAEIKEEAIEALQVQADTLLPELLYDLALNDPDPEFRVEAVGMMQDLPVDVALPTLERTLRALPDRSSEREVLLEIISILGEIATPEAAEILDLAMEGSDLEVSLEVIDALAEMPADIAAPRLEALARSHPYLEIREEALEQLPEVQGNARLPEVLLDLALNSTDPTVREQAADQLEELPADQAVELLGRVALGSADPETQQDAVESLGELGSPEALELLDRVVRETDNEEVTLQAVESMGEFPEDLAGPLLRQIASDHPSLEVRREALDQLGG